MDTLYNQTNKLIQQTQQCFQLLESNVKNAVEIEAEIQEKIDSINRDKMPKCDLLNRRFAPNPDITAINIDYAIQHQNSLQNANKGVDEMLHTGANALESLRSQRMTLKGAQRRIMDMANTLGLSNHTMRLIEKELQKTRVLLVSGSLGGRG
ncbi:hypothetical protein NQ318_010881 [Aromia moschata]|uniref:Uncharacterized protein n=1 Tax=Aromia moschata TaxID=1265417 RepID=A0AAV8X6F2_9CUCU|nr:hypothetical protein NQ318_010881 [Aromia moschata]